MTPALSEVSHLDVALEVCATDGAARANKPARIQEILRIQCSLDL